jgi:branched-chain amino acid transport system ATP-binding protein
MLLELEDVHVHYGKVEALKGVSLTVDEGEIVTLIGGNGAGKSTTLKTISGLRPVTSGAIRFKGESIVGAAPYRLVEQGISQAPEGRGIFPGMSVTENLEMGAYARGGGRAALAEDFDRVFQLFPRLQERRKQLGGTLSGGEQQMLAIGRALMARPTVLLLDEPSMGLAPLMVQKVFETIITVSKEGVTMLLIEQNAKLALEVSDRGYVMESGEITLRGEASALLHDPKVRAAYLGETA